MDLLRFATAGSVDDGKSTLIGRLLYDTGSVLDDQHDALQRVGFGGGHGQDEVNLALLTDGLRAEREQGITIDVAYRYFSTATRRFIIADTPGHVQYTRNMVTGASNAELAVVLVDARHGLVEQSRRHLAVSSVLGVRHLVVCVNKMDLVGWDAYEFDVTSRQIRTVARQLGHTDITIIPISALNGDNVVTKSEISPWYEGPSLLEHLETVPVGETDNNAVRFPVQYVIRDHKTDYRGYAGRLASGVLRIGDEIVVGPVGSSAIVTSINSGGAEKDEAEAGQSISIRLDREIDISRGDLISKSSEPTPVNDQFQATVCWMSEKPLQQGQRFAMKQATRWTPVIVEDVQSKLDLKSLEQLQIQHTLVANDIGVLKIKTTSPIPFDSYNENRHTGSFILTDEIDGETVGAGIIESSNT